jgi:hypothetical protein
MSYGGFVINTYWFLKGDLIEFSTPEKPFISSILDFGLGYKHKNPYSNLSSPFDIERWPTLRSSFMSFPLECSSLCL